MNYKDYFKNKKITVMGLGLLGRGLGDVKFLAECDANLIVTDLKNKEQLQSSLEQLKGFKNIEYVLGEHRFEDFRNRDMILKAAGVPLDSPFIAEARKNNIPIEMSSALFAKLTPATIIGITGTRGKTTVTYLLYEVLKKVHGSKKIFLGGNVQGVATLPFLKETKEGDIAVLELDSWQLQGFGEDKISPYVSIFTNFLNDHLNYYKNNLDNYLDDKANIFRYQGKNDYLILGAPVAEIIFSKYKNIKSKTVVAHLASVPSEWSVLLPGTHNRYNISLVLEAAKILDISSDVVREVVENFKGVSGRLELIKEKDGIKIYNDTTSTTPDALIAGLEALGRDKNIILIMGGADKSLDMASIFEVIPRFCKKVILLPGTGTDKLTTHNSQLKTLEPTQVKTLKEAVEISYKEAKHGDIILFSPGFASFGMFLNEYDRGEKFNVLVKNL